MVLEEMRNDEIHHLIIAGDQNQADDRTLASLVQVVKNSQESAWVLLVLGLDW